MPRRRFLEEAGDMRTKTLAGCVFGLFVAIGAAACSSGSATRTEGGVAGNLADGGGGKSGDVANAGGAIGKDALTTEAGVASTDVPIGTGDAAGVPDGSVGSDGAGSTVADGQIAALDGKPGPGNSVDSGLVCGNQGASCRSAADCCGLECVAGVCAAAACVSDGKACSSGGQCCSTVCGVGGTCTPLNPLCKTAGNACASGADCCSKVCGTNHQCAAPSSISYCAQTGDICRMDNECCTGVCAMGAGASAGTCATITTSCQIDGTVCNGCGSCCSHFCGPFGAGGPPICQPASGCHVQGDLCRKDSDCCGGDVKSGLPGAGLIACEPDPVYPSRIGTCGGPKASNCPGSVETCRNSCNPEGNVCHYKQTLVCAGSLTNVRNDCCGCISGKECCQPDATGIPRCNSLAACVPVGGHCSFSGECCGGQPCLPDPTTGELLCGASCVPAGGTCTTNHDCCTGMVCQSTPGALAGVCEVPVTPPPATPDAGVPDSGNGIPDSSGSSDDLVSNVDAPVCAYYGQSCSVSVPCCGSTCTNGAGLDCTATDTDCICFSPE
jgi:hypothetical protein